MKQSIAGIFYSGEKYLIGRRLPVGEMGGRWEFPGGKVDAGESPETAILREFAEEMNITVTIGNCITSVHFNNRNGPVQLLAYRLYLPENPEITLTEHSEIKWATMSEIESLDFVDSDRLLFPCLKNLERA